MRSFVFAVLFLCGLLAGCGQKSADPTLQTGSVQTTFAKSDSASLQPKATAPLKKATAATTLKAGTAIPVESLEVIDSDSAQALFVMGEVAEDVMGPDGGVAIPAKATALLVVRDVNHQGSRTALTLALNRIQFGNKTLKYGAGAKDLATLRFEEDAALGPGHRSIHLQGRTFLSFKPDAAIELP